MTIGKGTSWGEPGTLPEGAPLARSDSELGALVTLARRAGRPIPTAGLLGGSLWRTLGGAAMPGRVHGPDAWRYPIDVVQVVLDGSIEHWFVAHLVARRPFWREAVVAMSSQWLGSYQLGHRAHPNDGLLDVYEAHLGLGELAKVARRAKSGAHLPHPGIRERRVPHADITFDSPRVIRADGQIIGRTRTLSLRVEPDAMTVVL